MTLDKENKINEENNIEQKDIPEWYNIKGISDQTILQIQHYFQNFSL